MRYRIKFIRDYEIEVDIDATSRSDALAKVMHAALDCDARDQKETKIVSITETPKDVLHPSN